MLELLYEILKEPFVAGIVIALVTYGVILVWSLLARLNWLPRVMLHAVRVILSRLQRLPLLGRAVAATRRHPLSLGLLAAILTGVLIPALVISLTFLLVALTFMAIMYVAIRYGDWEDMSENEIDAHRLYFAHFTNEIVPGADPYADKDRPYL